MDKNNEFKYDTIYKLEGSLIFQTDYHVLTWGPFYYHSKDKAKARIDYIVNLIIQWCNSKDPSMDIKPEDLKRTRSGNAVVFKIKAWRNPEELQDCEVLVEVNDIFFEDDGYSKDND